MPNARAFYFWRTTLSLSPLERRALIELKISKLYLRLFDVGWSEQDAAPRPQGLLIVPQNADLPTTVEIVPVIFVQQAALRALDEKGVASLATNLSEQVSQRLAVLNRSARELQLDCDWTDTTRAPFFRLLTLLEAQLAPRRMQLSATIRLHQIKYRERTGVPPVARGMLMVYNMGSVDSNPGTQAIFDPQIAGNYMERLADYPLPLDVALPIWSWVVHVRGKRVVGLMQSTDIKDLADKPWIHPTAQGNRFEVGATNFLNGSLLRSGDFLDVERTTPGQSLAAAQLVSARFGTATKPRTVALFDLSEGNLSRHDTKSLESVFNLP